LKKYKEYINMASDDEKSIYFKIGKCYEKKADYRNAFNNYLLGDKKNDDLSQLSLGYMFHKGLGFAPDVNKAMFWYNKAASNGNAMALNNIGSIYLSGEGVPVNLNIARDYLIKAINQGCDLGYYNMGRLYHQVNDYRSAFGYFQKGLELKHAESINYLGIYYEKGYFVNRDYNKALEYYKKAGNLGSVIAQNNAGCIYYNHSSQKEKATYWFKKAAQANYAPAIENLRKLKF
jgi:TPR repeat protein